jgi:ABC-type spermidine/putrescine transport system permease subunit I
MRSLYEPVGLIDSSLTSTSADPGATTWASFTSGVLPMAWSTDEAMRVILAF